MKKPNIAIIMVSALLTVGGLVAFASHKHSYYKNGGHYYHCGNHHSDHHMNTKQSDFTPNHKLQNDSKKPE